MLMIEFHFPEAYDLSTPEAKKKLHTVNNSIYCCYGGVLHYPEGVWVRDRKEVIVYLTPVWSSGWADEYPHLRWDLRKRAAHAAAFVYNLLAPHLMTRNLIQRASP